MNFDNALPITNPQRANYGYDDDDLIMSPRKDHVFLDLVPELNPTSRTRCDKHFLKEFTHSSNILKCVFCEACVIQHGDQNRDAA